MNAEHAHQQKPPRGPVFEFVYSVSMLFGRGSMARIVVDQADLSTGDLVVDVGCGPGTAVRRARREGATTAVGIDPSPEMLRFARWITSVLRMDGACFLEGSAECLPLDSASATVLWALQSVHHWEDWSRGLKESLRVLAPGGRLVLLERSVTPSARGHAAHGLSEQAADDLASLLSRTGFTNVVKRVVFLGHRNFVVVTASAPAS
jgi:ubiquinone/menaquinone biosynthesis C-methylase UbiE